MPTIATERLELPLMTEAFMRACLDRHQQQAEALLGASLSPSWFAEMGFLALRVEQLRQDPSYSIWGPRAVVLRTAKRVIGHIGFHGTPNQAHVLRFVPAGIEFGYTIDADFRRQGFAFEASLGLMRWATLEHGVRCFVLSISPSNTASQALASKLGFVKIGQQLDEIDGPEDVLKLDGAALEHWLGSDRPD